MAGSVVTRCGVTCSDSGPSIRGEDERSGVCRRRISGVIAIAGIFLLDGRPAEQPVLQCMVDKLAHRGPDGAGVWHEGSIGLGHRMLWTTPQSLHEELPLRDAGYALVANARIDNREELCDLLGLDRRDLAEVTDSYLILRAYQKWGEACPTRLLGDFTFAIWEIGRAHVELQSRENL